MKMKINALRVVQSLFVILVATARISEQRSPLVEVCGKTNGCFKWPRGCKVLECKIVVRFLVVEKAQMTIEVSGKTDGWVAFGLNDKPRVMGGVQGEVCMKGSTSGIVLKSFRNEGTEFHSKPLSKNISVTAVAYKNGRLTCSYRRALKSSTLLDISKPYYVISSWGKTRMKDSKIHAHEHTTGDYFWSKSKVVLTKGEDIDVTTFQWDLIAAHGSLMVIAWIGFGFSAIFYARHMKDVWAQRKICGSTLWFQAHRISFFICIALVIVAFIIILAEVGGWNSEMVGHTVLGIITIVLACLQVIAGIVRPPVNSSKRIIFKYVHRMTGAITYILAVVTIFFGLSAIGVDLAVFILYLVVIIIIFIGHEALAWYKSRTVAEVPYKDAELDSVESESSSSEEAITYSAKEMFIRKAIGIFVAGLGIGMAVIIFSLIAHKGYVYHKKGIAA